MRKLLLLTCALAVLALQGGAGFAQDDRIDVEDVDPLIGPFLESQFLTLQEGVLLPSMQPKLTTLKRGWSPNANELIEMFLGSREAIMEDEEIYSPLWGRGRRYKSGTVLYLMDKGTSAPRDIGGLATEVEVVPSFLDIYSTGFAYVNNVPHKPVYATDVEVESATSANVSYRNVYEIDEGQVAAEKLIADTIGELTVPDGFQPAVRAVIQDFSERLFAYSVRPEYITEYDVYEYHIDPAEDSQLQRVAIGTQPASVPVWDVKVQMLLDGDKLLAGLDYFWDDSIGPAGEPQECIHAGTALVAARAQLLEYYNNEPPLLTITNLSLGFIQDRADRSMLVPVWLFDAWYTETVMLDPENLSDAPPLTSPYARNVVQVPVPFAINALTEELYVL